MRRRPAGRRSLWPCGPKRSRSRSCFALSLCSGPQARAVPSRRLPIRLSRFGRNWSEISPWNVIGCSRTWPLAAILAAIRCGPITIPSVGLVPGPTRTWRGHFYFVSLTNWKSVGSRFGPMWRNSAGSVHRRTPGPGWSCMRRPAVRAEMIASARWPQSARPSFSPSTSTWEARTTRSRKDFPTPSRNVTSLPGRACACWR
jgi:hypothetical protein